MTQRPKQQLHKAVVDQLAWRARPGVWWCHYPAGGWRSPIEAAIMKRLGVRAGVPDLLIIANGRAHFLELKAPRGRVSDVQHETHENLCAAGARIAVVRDIDEALERLTTWGLLRGRCPYCSAGKRTGLPGNACENCMNTGLANPTIEDLQR